MIFLLFINPALKIFHIVTRVQMSQSPYVWSWLGVRYANEVMDLQRDAPWDSLQRGCFLNSSRATRKRNQGVAGLKVEHSFKFDENHGCFQNIENCLMFSTWAQSQKQQAEQCVAYFLNTWHKTWAIQIFCSGFDCGQMSVDHSVLRWIIYRSLYTLHLIQYIVSYLFKNTRNSCTTRASSF